MNPYSLHVGGQSVTEQDSYVLSDVWFRDDHVVTGIQSCLFLFGSP